MVGQALLHHTSLIKMQIAVITVQGLWLPVAAQGKSDETTTIAVWQPRQGGQIGGATNGHCMSHIDLPNRDGSITVRFLLL